MMRYEGGRGGRPPPARWLVVWVRLAPRLAGLELASYVQYVQTGRTRLLPCPLGNDRDGDVTLPNPFGCRTAPPLPLLHWKIAQEARRRLPENTVRRMVVVALRIALLPKKTAACCWCSGGTVGVVSAHLLTLCVDLFRSSWIWEEQD
ncbi:hypothetical protein BP00DRAFT_130373 [Aspergillus indologenus CBS 114.80]|uniref:Ig-like domain-containing protein n=1 Tax=Aspergillus indologenus CBS 114.80 TaxID=1450541 RepID=A0A2V5IWL2_9EURO|nr:hypothetical protein BP00DRAFT_130373 [Aspergillus indologenus CBS 114.80]